MTASDQASDPTGVVMTPASLRQVLDALPNAVIVTGPDGRVTLWNATAERLYGWAEAEVLGIPVVEILSFGPPQDLVTLGRVAGGLPTGDYTLATRSGELVRVAQKPRNAGWRRRCSGHRWRFV